MNQVLSKLAQVPSRIDFLRYGQQTPEGNLVLPQGFRGSGGGGGIDLVNPLGTYSFQVIIDRIINGLLLLAAPIVVIMVLWGAFLLITSGGNPIKVSQGWRVILWAAVGYGVLLLASGINLIIQQLLGIY